MKEPIYKDEDSYYPNRNINSNSDYNAIAIDDYLNKSPIKEESNITTINEEENVENFPDQNIPSEMKIEEENEEKEQDKSTPSQMEIEEENVENEPDQNIPCQMEIEEENEEKEQNKSTPSKMEAEKENEENEPEKNTLSNQIEAIGNVSQNNKNERNDFPFSASSYQNKIQGEKLSESTRPSEVKFTVKRARPDEDISNNISQNNQSSNRDRIPIKSNKTGDHNKTSKDNMASKIKPYSLASFIKLINEKFIDLNVKFNLALIGKKLKDILIDYPISKKYKTKNPASNKNLIEKYMQKKEKLLLLVY